jgi:hypothetical protein
MGEKMDSKMDAEMDAKMDAKMNTKMAEIPEINPSKKFKNSESPITEKTGQLVASKLSTIQPNWLNFQVDMSLGHRANVFYFYKPDEILDSDSTSYSRNGVEHKVRLVVNPQACSFVDKNVLDTISEVNNHIIDTLFWLKNDIATTTKSQGNLFQRLLQLDQGTNLSDGQTCSKPKKTHLKLISEVSEPKSEKSGSLEKSTPKTTISDENSIQEQSTSKSTSKSTPKTPPAEFGRPFKTTAELSQTLLSDLVCMIDHTMIQSQINLMDKFLEVLVKTCKKLPYTAKSEESDEDNEIATLQKAIID